MCLLVAFQFIKQSLQIDNVTKEFQLNRYMNLLVREGMLYFLTYVLFHATITASYYEQHPGICTPQFAGLHHKRDSEPMVGTGDIATNIPTITLVPRFILSFMQATFRADKVVTLTQHSI